MLLDSLFPSLGSCGRAAGYQQPRLALPTGSPRLLLEPLETRALLSFLPAVPYPIGLNAIAVAVADFNKDNVPDLVVTVFDSPVRILLGNGDGTFHNAGNFPAGDLPFAVTPGDFNGDGNLDLAVTNWGNIGVSVLLGNGDGSFQAGVFYGLSGVDRPEGIATADFNHDGNLDLVTSNLDQYPVSVLLGNGDGTFQSAVNLDGGPFARSVIVEDFDGDGNLDIAVAKPNIRILTVHYGDGTGAFPTRQSFNAGSTPTGVASGDVNGDNIPDLLAADNDGQQLVVLLGNGDGSFQNPTGYILPSRSPYRTVLADFNGDGKLDAATNNFDTNDVSVLPGNGDGSFQGGPTYGVGTYCIGLSVGDFNGDGFPDLVTANYSSNDVSILLNAADDAAFFYLDAPAQVTAGQPFDLTAYALSGHGQRLAHGYRGTVALWSSDKAATLPEPYTFRPEDGGIVASPGGVTLRTPGLQELYAFDLETFTVIGYAVVEVLGTAPGGSDPNPGAADFALAEVSLDLVTWTRPRRSAWTPEGSPSPS